MDARGEDGFRAGAVDAGCAGEVFELGELES